MSKISELSDGGSLVSSDYLIAVRSGGNVKVRMNQINVDQVDLGDNEFIRLGNSQDLTMVHTSTQSIINQAGIGDLLIQKAGTTKASITANGLEFPDNSKAIFGAGSDLQIYHDGSASFISDQGTGHLKLLAGDFRLNNAADNAQFISAVNGAEVNLYYNNAPKLATTATGIDVTGSVTATAVNTGAGAAGRNAFSSGDIRVAAPNDTNISLMTVSNTLATIKTDFYGGGSLVPLVLQTGANTNQLYLDTAGNVGIGTSSPFFTAAGRTSLSVNGTSSSILAFGKGGSSENYILADAGGFTIANTSATLPTAFFNNGATRMTIDANGNVGIGVTPSAWWTGFEALQLGESAALTGRNGGVEQCNLSSNAVFDLTDVRYEYVMGTSNEATLYQQTDGTHRFNTAPAGTAGNPIAFSESVRIDASGNLLVSKTATSFSVAGIGLMANDQILATAASDNSLALNRLTTNGDIARFYKDSVQVGSIGTESGNVFLNSVSTGLLSTVGTARYKWDVDQFYPNGDNAKNLGTPANRFKDIYRSGSTFQTSDRTMKQDIRDLTDAERNVAVACKGLLKAFRFIDTVEKEGVDANIHFGIIAQDLAAAFAAEGLDANDYQAYKAIVTTDEDGNEQTSLNVCYENLLAFIIAAI